MTAIRTRFLSLTALAAVTALFLNGPAYGEEEHESNPPKLTAAMPVTIGWYDGGPSFYISTDTSDQAMATALDVNYSPALGNAANTAAVDDIYTVTNFAQGNIVPSSPIPAGPGNTNAAYSPFWQLSKVTWNQGVTPHLLRSEADVLATRDAGMVSIVKTDIVINCSVFYTAEGDVLPGTRFSVNRKVGGKTVSIVDLPITIGWFNGEPALYVSTDASSVAATGSTANLSTAIGNAANTPAVDDIYTVTNFSQGNVIPSAPTPLGPKSSSLQYSPAWQLSQVTWKNPAVAHTLKSEAEILTAKARGLVTIKKTNIVINCPVISTPSGGTLAGVSIKRSAD